MHPSPSRRARLTLVLSTVVALAMFVAAGYGLLTVAALKAAGIGRGTPIQGLGTFIGHLKGNLAWLAATSIGLAIVVVALLFIFGHTRAQDIALKTLAGAAILASLGGIVA